MATSCWWSSLSENLAQISRRLVHGATHCRGVGDRVEQHEVVDGAVVADRGDGNSRRGELASIGLALVAQHVVLIDEEKRLLQALQLLGAGIDRRDMDVGAL